MGIETVIVAVGPTEERRVNKLIETVLDVAGPHEAKVVVFHAFTEAAFEDGVERLDADEENPPTPAELAKRLESVATMMDELAAAGLSYEVASDISDPRDGILEAVDDADADMLFVGGRKRSNVGKALSGSTAQQVMMNAPCPVVFVRQELAGE